MAITGRHNPKKSKSPHPIQHSTFNIQQSAFINQQSICMAREKSFGRGRTSAKLLHFRKPPLPPVQRRNFSQKATEGDPINVYSAAWMNSFGSISDPTFHAPERSLPRPVQPLDATA